MSIVLHQFYRCKNDHIIIENKSIACEKFQINIWSTAGQHLVIICCLNWHRKKSICRVVAKKRHFTVILTQFMRDHVIGLVSFKYDLWCKNHLFFVKNTSVNMWSTFRQHPLPKCTCKDSWNWLIFHNKVDFQRIFRQLLLTKCWPNVEIWIFCEK